MKLREKGFTLIELTVSLALLVAVSSIAAGGVFQILMNVQRNSNHMTAVMQAQNYCHSITQDTQRAQSITTDGLGSTELFTLNWIDAEGSTHLITYTWEDIPGSSRKNIMRNLSVSGSANQTSLMAKSVDPDPANTYCSFTEGVFTFKITVVVGDAGMTQSETRTGIIVPRPG